MEEEGTCRLIAAALGSCCSFHFLRGMGGSSLPLLSTHTRRTGGLGSSDDPNTSAHVHTHTHTHTIQVDSALVTIDFPPTREPFTVAAADLRRVVSTGFGQRRKMLRQSLKHLLKVHASAPSPMHACMHAYPPYHTHTHAHSPHSHPYPHART